MNGYFARWCQGVFEKGPVHKQVVDDKKKSMKDARFRFFAK